MKKPEVCVLRTAGTNCDKETAFVFEKAGGALDLIHINELISLHKNLDNYQILAIPGGFSYGDDLGAGKILANELKFKLADSLQRFIGQGKLIIGICNGFQILVKAGLLPGNSELEQETSLIINDSGKFEDRWTYLRTTHDACLPTGRARRTAKCVWAQGLPEIIYLPVAHGEGKFITDKKALGRLKRKGQIVFQYCSQEGKLTGYPDNPNGSMNNIAGICDETGRILGLMPHPERHISITQHPRWESNKVGGGLQIIKNGVEYARKNL